MIQRLVARRNQTQRRQRLFRAMHDAAAPRQPRLRQQYRRRRHRRRPRRPACPELQANTAASSTNDHFRRATSVGSNPRRGTATAYRPAHRESVQTASWVRRPAHPAEEARLPNDTGFSRAGVHRGINLGPAGPWTTCDGVQPSGSEPSSPTTTPSSSSSSSSSSAAWQITTRSTKSPDPRSGSTM